MHSRRTAWTAGLAAAGLAFLLACGGGERPPEVRASLSVAEALAGGDEGFLLALEPRVFRFPADHGPHPGFRTEWWYFTGNLEAAGGRRFGFQLTFFRNQLVPQAPRRASPWAAEAVWMAHFALTDAAGRRFHAFERFARGAAGLAGARGGPFRVWLEDWRAVSSGDGFTPLRLEAAAGEVALDLTLEAAKPPVLQGDSGLSRKGPEPGNASYYYSLTRMPARGTVTVAGEAVPVTGLAWMDREWSTSVLSPGQVGWDWFSLQLDDGRDLMFYRLRRDDGSPDPRSAGSLVAADGSRRPLSADEVVLEVLERWESPASGALYPARWRLALPREGLELTVEPLLAGQELDLTFRYWEGAVAVTGASRGRPVSGRGYVELTGYGEGTSTPPGT